MGSSTSETNQATSTPGSVSSNMPPSIRGVPPTRVVAGAAYSFAPQARDPEGARLSFAVTRKPLWATFSADTGMLQGKPGPNDVGTYDNIVITVTDGVHQVPLPKFRVDVLGTATGAISVGWTAPTQREDGSPLTDLAGYKLYWGTSAGNYPNSVTIDNVGIASYVIEQLPPGTYYVVATAFDSRGVESRYSNVKAKTVL